MTANHQKKNPNYYYLALCVAVVGEGGGAAVGEGKLKYFSENCASFLCTLVAFNFQNLH